VAEESTPTSDQAPEAPGGFRPKPPLWQPKPEPPAPLAGRVAAGVLMLAALAAIPFLLEGQFLSVPMGQVEATVVQIEAGRPADEDPARFVYLVALGDGSKKRFVCDRILQPGDGLLVTASRGRLTGRIRLGAPYRVVPRPPDSPVGR